MKAKRRRSADDKLAFVRYSPLVETILRNAVRSGTLAIIAGVDLSELNRVVNLHRDFCWRTQSQLHLSHYTSSHDRGSLHPSNLGIWPARLNFRLGKESLPIGHSISDRHWHDSGLFCSGLDEAWKVLQRRYGKILSELAAREPDSPYDMLRKPARQDAYKRLRKAGYKGNFSTVHYLPTKEFESLCERYGLEIKSHREPSESDRLSLNDLLHRELNRQAQLYPHVKPDVDAVINAVEGYPDQVADEVLSLAVIHKFKEAILMANDYKEIKVVARKRDNFATEVHTWRGEDQRWHSTDLPTNPQQMYTAYSKQYGEPFPF